MRRLPHSTALVGWIIAATSAFALACREGDLAGPDIAAARSRPAYTIGDGSADCPDGVPPEDCVPVTQQQRTDLWWDLQIGIRWEIEDCANIGYQMQDFVLTGDVRVYPDPTHTLDWGQWQIRGGFEQISFNADVFTQGWSHERLPTAIHEGYHHWAGGGSEWYAYGFEAGCVNN
jgi:hypothetical protein